MCNWYSPQKSSPTSPRRLAKLKLSLNAFRTDKKPPSHPQAELPTRCSRCYPVIARVKLCNSRHGRDAISAQLRELLTFGGVDIDKAVHVPNAEAVDAVAGVLLPLCAETAQTPGG